jgi:hypothetical protein
MWKSEQQVQQFVEKKINHSMREDWPKQQS